MTHYGVNGHACCGASHLLAGSTTSDLQAVECLACLWNLLGETIAAVDRIAMRIRIVVTERTPTERLVQ